MSYEDVVKLLGAVLIGGGATGGLGLWWFKRWTGTVDQKLDSVLEKFSVMTTAVAVLSTKDEVRKGEIEKLETRLHKLNNVLQRLLLHTRAPIGDE